MRAHIKKMLAEHNWLDMLADRCEKNVTSFELNKWDLQPSTWTVGGGVFIEGDANMNDSLGRKTDYPSAGLKIHVFGRRGRKWVRVMTTTGDRGRKLGFFGRDCS